MLQMEQFKPVVNVKTETPRYPHKSENGCRLKSCLQETIRKIDDLESQVLSFLMIDNRYFEGG